jgi:hypothetical protein
MRPGERRRMAAIWAIAVAAGMSFHASAQRAVARRRRVAVSTSSSCVRTSTSSAERRQHRRANRSRRRHPRDSGSTAMADEVLAAIRRLTPLPIRYIINTSMDADHVGGNDKLARAGLSILPGAVVAGAGLSDDLVSNSGRASVMAHENVQTRMTAASGPRRSPAHSGRRRRSPTGCTRCI